MYVFFKFREDMLDSESIVTTDVCMPYFITETQTCQFNIRWNFVVKLVNGPDFRHGFPGES